MILRFRRPVGALAVALLSLSAACGKKANVVAGPPAGPRPNLLLITVDTLRADHLSSYGYVRATSPRIDRLALEGVRFAAAQTQWPKTGPSFASLLSSTYPKDNDIVRQVGIPVPCSFTMVAEALQRAGYSTHAVVANGAVGREFYFDQGFGSFVETWKRPPEGSALAPGEGGRVLGEAEEAMIRAAKNLADPNGAENVTRLAIESASTFAGDKPWFLWVHYLDPHFPYSPPKEYRDRFQGDEHFDGTTQVPVSDRHQQELSSIGKGQVLDGETRLGFYVARYDAEIAYTDAQIGRLLDDFGNRGLLANTLTAFTADHGESLGEHDYFFNHGRFAFQTCLHVPLVLTWPGKIAPRVDAQPVELINLSPTLLAAAGIELPGGRWAQGRSLWSRLLGGAPEPRDLLSFSEGGTAMRRNWIKVVRDERFALQQVPTHRERGWIGGADNEFPLFDLVADPGELHDVSAEHPEVVARLQGELSGWWNADRFQCSTDKEKCDENRAVDEKTTEQLKALGYL